MTKTLRLNLHYFGWGGLLTPYIICSRNVSLVNVKGKVIILQKKLGIVRIGFGNVQVIDGRYERNVWNCTGTIVFEGDAHFCKGARLIVAGELRMGNHFIVNGNTSIIANKQVTFGADCLLSWGGLIMDTDFHPIYSIDAPNDASNPDQPITIGDHCWIGCRSLILKGTSLPNGTIVAAGSTLCGKWTEENSVITGKAMLKNNVSWGYRWQ